MLVCLAELSGHHHALSALPDGSVPDVVRLAATGRRVFLGDAKESEDHYDSGSLARLARYLRWMLGMARGGYGCSVAVCAPSGAAAAGWSTAVELLLAERQATARPLVLDLGAGASVSWTGIEVQSGGLAVGQNRDV